MNRPISLILMLLLLLSSAAKLSAQGTTFNYQGRLSDSGSPANGSYDLRFAVYNAVTNGSQVSISLTNFSVATSNGLFSTTLDFGSLFTGTNYWLDIAVRATNVVNFTALAPRQPILPVPYAIFANTASNVLGTVPATQLTGTVPSAQISGTYSGAVNFANAGNSFSGTFSGNGAALNSLNGSQISSGTVADARLTPNVALLDHNQTFTGTNQFYGVNNFTNRGNSFVGSFFGNGLVGWIPVNGTATQAMPDAGYLLTSSGQTTVTLPPTAALLVGDIVRISGAGVGGWQVVGNAGQSFIGNFASYQNSFMQPTALGSDWRRMASSSSGNRMYAGGNFSGGVYCSSDLGHTWSPTGITGSGWFSVACSADGSKAYAAPNGGNIQASSNAGLTFVPFGSSANWTVIACSADATRFVAGASSGALTLSTGSSPASGNWTAVACSSDATNIAAAIGSNVYTTTNAGSSWITNPVPATCWALAAASSGFKLVAAYNGGIVTSTNFGASWTTNAAGVFPWTCLAASSDCTRLVAGVSNGLFYASANFGATWTAVTSTNQFWSGACMSADGTTFAGSVRTIGPAGGIYYSGAGAQPNTVTTNSIVGSQGSAVELQYIGNNRFMPVSSTGALWSN